MCFIDDKAIELLLLVQDSKLSTEGSGGKAFGSDYKHHSESANEARTDTLRATGRLAGGEHGRTELTVEETVFGMAGLHVVEDLEKLS